MEKNIITEMKRLEIKISENPNDQTYVTQLKTEKG